ncbi:MAG TPA: vWA domain-containing protein [Vicinamibacterales bacterium]|nr:vWA domain-containing protein [Vicinamibacterales bacterium]
MILRFADPAWLPLLALPSVLLLLWIWQLLKRSRDRQRIARAQRRPASVSGTVAPRLALAGDLPFWLSLIAALALTIVALARPLEVTSRVRTGGVDIVVLQDGSASMRVRDVARTSAGPDRSDRWQRSMQFLRTLGESLRWERDRMALAVFAGVATPQIRLTRDPNTFFFFLDHLDTEPPFRLRDAGTWDTNIERGIYWGMRLVEKDEEVRGPSENGRAFILLSDGQAWSGEVEKSIALVRARGAPLHVIGVGTTGGGVIPEPNRSPAAAPLSSVLDRDSLSVIATAGGGRYFELDREPDSAIANVIIDSTRARAPVGAIAEGTRELYRDALLGAAGFLILGIAFRAFRP